jgi:methyl-accepting chemotaxis protein
MHGFRDLKIGTRLGLLVGFLAVVLTAIGLVGLYGIRQTNASLETVYRDRVVPLRMITQAANNYAVGIVDTCHKVRSGAVSWEDGLAAVEDAQANTESTWASYMKTSLTTEEQALADRARALFARTDARVADLRGILRARNAEALAAFADKDLYPAIDPISAQLDKLTLLQLDVAKSEFDRSQEAYATLRTLCVTAICSV